MPKTPDERRQQLVDTAQKLFVRDGFYETSVSDIVKECGVAQGTFYYYFKTKEEILNEVIAKVSFQYLDSLQEELKKIDSPKEKLRFLIHYTFQKVPQKEFSSSCQKIESQSLQLLNFDLIKNFYEKIQPLLHKILEDGIKMKEFSVKYPDFAVMALMGVSREVVITHLYYPEKKPDFQQLTEQFLDFYGRLLNTVF